MLDDKIDGFKRLEHIYTQCKSIVNNKVNQVIMGFSQSQFSNYRQNV